MKTSKNAVLVVFKSLITAILILPIIILLGASIIDEISDNTYLHPEKYTILVPAYLEPSKPKIIKDSGNFMGGGVFAVQMDLGPGIAKQIKDNPKFLVGPWNRTPVPEKDIRASQEAEFLMYVENKQLANDIRQPGNFWMSKFWPQTGRLGIFVATTSNHVYYIESGN